MVETKIINKENKIVISTEIEVNEVTTLKKAISVFVSELEKTVSIGQLNTLIIH